MRKLFVNGLVIFAGVLTTDAPVCNSYCSSALQENVRPDPRLAALQEYFALGNCPALAYSEEFLRVADKYDLDWRLLPSLAVIETSGGKGARNHNLFGWDNGQARFSSGTHAIRHVASTLAESSAYRNKSLDGLLRTYNPVAPDYGTRVKSVMMNIGRRARPPKT